MKIHQLLPIFVVAAVAYAYDFDVFNKEIDPKCLNRLWNQYDRDFQPLALTMESFISMVEKVEAKHRDWNLYDITRVLLKRFAFEGIVFQERANKRTATQQTEYINRWFIVRPLVAEDPKNLVFQEDDLTEIEKCTMFLMMGHLVNNTFREGDDLDESLAPHDSQPEPMGVLKAPAKNAKRAKRPREQGVVTVRGDQKQAVSVSKVLNAILASHNKQPYNIYDLFTSTVQSIKDFPRDKMIDPLIAVTVGDVLSLSAIHKREGTSGRRFFGSGGEWNSTLCPTEYKLLEKSKGATNALLRGAIDGLAIGRTLQRQTGREDDNLLSRLLRMYYSKTGLSDSAQSSSVQSYCKRAEVPSIVGMNEIASSTISFYYVHYAKELAQLGLEVDSVIGEATSNMQTALSELDGELAQSEGECSQRFSSPTAEQPRCETPSNVFIVLDTSEIRTEGFSEQEEIIGHLTNKLDIGRGGGSLSVFLDGKGGENGGLKHVYFNATNPACATCATQRIDRIDGTRFEGETVLLDGLNKTLQYFEQRIQEEPGVPNKVVIIFRYTDIQDSDKSRLAATVNMLRNGHRDSRVIVVGKNVDSLLALTPDRSDVLTPMNNAKEQANIIYEKICKVPATFQFHRCWDHNKSNRKEEDNVYDGYVTPNHVQYWAFYPEYFLKSYDIQIKITATNGDIRVCEERGVSTPGFKETVFLKDRCKETSSGSRELTFHFKNPCHKHHVHNCNPINLSIIGLSSTQRSTSCPASDPKCRRLDQINFKVAHHGVFCSGCEFLKASPIVLLVVSIAYFFNKST